MPTARPIADMTWLPYRIGMRDPGFRTAGGGFPAITGCFVFLHLADGTVGRGAAIAQERFGLGSQVVAAYLRELRPRLLGQDAMAPGARMQELRRLRQVPAVVLAGIDCALHELNALAVGQPLHFLFGGPVRARVAQARMVPAKPAPAMAQAASALAGEGYGFLKVKLLGRPETDLAAVAAVREAVGPAARLMVDANGAFDLKDALAILPVLDSLGVEIFEEPLARGDVSGLRRLRDIGRLRIEADESANSIPAIARLLSAEAVDIVGLKVSKLGGLAATFQAACLCDAAGIPYRLGAAFGPALLQAQSLSLAACLPNLVWASEQAVFADLVDDPGTGLEVRDGFLAVSDRPDCGVRLHLGNAAGGA